MVTKESLKRLNAMTTIVATVKGIRVFENENSASVQLTLDKEVEGYKQDENGVFVKGMTKQVSFFRSALTAQLCDANDDIALYRACQERALGQRQFALILFNAKLKLNITEHSAGEVVEVNGTERTIERDCIFVDVAGVELAPRAVQCLNDAISL